jgi:bloom syndrome protein
MIIKNQEEQLTLMEQKASLADDDDLMGEDPEMIDMKMCATRFPAPSYYTLDQRFADEVQRRMLLAKRLKEFKAALASRSGGTPGGHLAGPPSSGSTMKSGESGESRALPSTPTADVVPVSGRPRDLTLGQAGPSRSGVLGRTTTTPMDNRGASSPSKVVQSLVSDEEDVPLAQLRRSSSGRQRPPTPPPTDEYDIAMAEEFQDDQPDFELSHELIPPSSPPPPPSFSTPPRSVRTVAPVQIDHTAALAELEDIPPDFFSSPPASAHTPNRPPPRAEASSARSIAGGPGPSSSAQRAEVAAQQRQLVQGPRTVKVDVKHPWTKEVEQKLRQVFKLPKFRTHQKEAVDETMAGNDGEFSVHSSIPLCTLALTDVQCSFSCPREAGRVLRVSLGPNLPRLP